MHTLPDDNRRYHTFTAADVRLALATRSLGVGWGRVCEAIIPRARHEISNSSRPAGMLHASFYVGGETSKDGS